MPVVRLKRRVEPTQKAERKLVQHPLKCGAEEIEVEQMAMESKAMPTQSELIAAAVAEFRAKMFEAFKAAEAAHNADLTDAKDALARAADFVNKAGLLGATVRLFEGTRFYHSWAKRGDWSEYNILGVTLNQGEPPGFRWRERDWGFALGDKRASHSGDETWATLSVTCDGALVMELRIATDHVTEFDRWRLISVEALSVGPWVSDLTEMDATMELVKQQKRHELDAWRFQDKASRIKF
jgi:hypothetical protein